MNNHELSETVDKVCNYCEGIKANFQKEVLKAAKKCVDAEGKNHWVNEPPEVKRVKPVNRASRSNGLRYQIRPIGNTIKAKLILLAKTDFRTVEDHEKVVEKLSQFYGDNFEKMKDDRGCKDYVDVDDLKAVLNFIKAINPFAGETKKRSHHGKESSKTVDSGKKAS